MPDANTVERLEVIRGPATSLYGRGDPGGTFNVVSKQPLPVQGHPGQPVRRPGHAPRHPDATGPLSQDGSLAYRLNVLGEGGESFRDDVESERYDVAPVISWQVNDATKIIFEGDFMRNNHPLDRGLTRYPPRPAAPRATPISGKKAATTCCTTTTTWPRCVSSTCSTTTGPWLAASSGSTAPLQGNAVEANGAPTDARCSATSTTASWSGPTATTSSTSPATSTPALQPYLVDRVEYEDYDYNSIIQRSSAAYPIDIYNPVLGQPRPALNRTTTHDKENLKTWAFFIQDQVALTERLKALAGVRFERFEHDYDNKLQCRRGLARATTRHPRVSA
jgi:iron complex outermembrane receptor protein